MRLSSSRRAGTQIPLIYETDRKTRVYVGGKPAIEHLFERVPRGATARKEARTSGQRLGIPAWDAVSRLTQAPQRR